MKTKRLELPEVDQLRGYLAAVGDILQTGEIRWCFEIVLFEVEEQFEVVDFLRSTYPDSRADSTKVHESSVADIIETFSLELGRFPSATTPRVLFLVSTQSAEFWEYLRACIDYENARIMEYFSSERDSLLHGLMGEFAMIFYNIQLKRALILIGATSD